VNPAASSPDPDFYQVMLCQRLTQGFVVERVDVDGVSVIATNVPPLRHASQSGFDFGNDGPGAQDLALACVQALLERMDYAGPTQAAWDGSRVYRLAAELQGAFLDQFIAPATGDEVRIPWSKALGWLRGALLERVRERGLTTDTVMDAWRASVDDLPDPPPRKELERAEAARALRAQLLELTDDASVLSQFLGLVG